MNTFCTVIQEYLYVSFQFRYSDSRCNMMLGVFCRVVCLSLVTTQAFASLSSSNLGEKMAQMDHLIIEMAELKQQVAKLNEKTKEMDSLI